MQRGKGFGERHKEGPVQFLRFGQLWDCLFKKAEKFLLQEGRKEKKEERERNQNGVDNTCILGCCEK